MLTINQIAATIFPFFYNPHIFLIRLRILDGVAYFSVAFTGADTRKFWLTKKDNHRDYIQWSHVIRCENGQSPGFVVVIVAGAWPRFFGAFQIDNL